MDHDRPAVLLLLLGELGLLLFVVGGAALWLAALRPMCRLWRRRRRPTRRTPRTGAVR